MMAKVFQAQREGICIKKKDKIIIGQRIAKDGQGFSHADCIWPSKANANPVTAQEDQGRGGQTNANPIPSASHEPSQADKALAKLQKDLEDEPEIDVLSQVSDNLADSIQIVRDGYKLKPEDSLTPYIQAISECQHEIFSLQVTREIQRSKLKNLGLIK